MYNDNSNSENLISYNMDNSDSDSISNNNMSNFCYKSFYRPAIFIGLLGVFLDSSSDVFAKLLTSFDYTIFQIMFISAITMFLGCSAILIKDKSLPFPHESRVDFLAWSIVSGLFSFIMIYLLYTAYTILPFSEVVIISAFNPVFTIILSKKIIGDKITRYKIIGCSLLVISVLISFNPINVYKLNFKDTSLWFGRMLALIAALFDSLSMICYKYLINNKTHYASQGWWQALIMIIISPTAFYFAPIKIMTNYMDIFYMLGIGLCDFLYVLTNGYILNYESALMTTVVNGSNIIFGLIWQSTIFNTPVEWYQDVAVLIILISLFVTAIEKPDQNKQSLSDQTEQLLPYQIMT